MMRRGFFDYDTYIFDVDGTLYFMGRMHLLMLFEVLKFCILHPFKFKDILVLKDYRKLRDKKEWSREARFEEKIVKKIALKYGMPEERVGEIVSFWLLDSAMMAVAKSKDKTILSVIEELQKKGKRIVLYSDYPTEQKCGALGITPDAAYYPDGRIIRYLKPNPQGLKAILKEEALTPSRVLFVGDRKEMDGRCAKACAVDCLILKRGRISRRKQYVKERIIADV